MIRQPCANSHPTDSDGMLVMAPTYHHRLDQGLTLSGIVIDQLGTGLSGSGCVDGIAYLQLPAGIRLAVIPSKAQSSDADSQITHHIAVTLGRHVMDRPAEKVPVAFT